MKHWSTWTSSALWPIRCNPPTASPAKVFPFESLIPEIQLLVILFAFENECYTPSTVSAEIHLICPTKMRTAPVPPLFHVNFLFRTEAMELAARIRCLEPLLAPTRTTQHLLPRNRLRQRLYKRALNYDFERRSSKTKRRPNLHFFNPLIELLSLDAIIKRSWANMALNLSPELRNTTRFLQLIVRRDEKWQNGHPR
jgi:hypothetical protein